MICSAVSSASAACPRYRFTIFVSQLIVYSIHLSQRMQNFVQTCCQCRGSQGAQPRKHAYKGNFQILKNNIHAEGYQAVAEDHAEPRSDRDSGLRVPSCATAAATRASMPRFSQRKFSHASTAPIAKPSAQANGRIIPAAMAAAAAKNQRQPSDALLRARINGRMRCAVPDGSRADQPFPSPFTGSRRKTSRTPAKNPRPPKTIVKMTLVCSQWSRK